MIRSMTGYGRGESAAGAKRIRVEVRSLNAKQLDLAVKLPPALRGVEYELRTLAAGTISRGKADVYVTLEQGAAGATTINGEVFADYFRQIREVADAAGLNLGFAANSDFNIGVGQAVLVPAILRLPDVLVSESSGEVTEAETAALMEAACEALAAFERFRAEEGAVLLKDILGHVAAIEELLRGVEPLEKARVDAVRARILEHIAPLGITVDPNRLEQELVFWIEKLDITEEKVRLTKHCAYFRETASGDEDAGRKLGFISQEMGREINTLGSKANDAGIQRLVVQMKDELEKIKEQLLNIL